MLYDMNIRGGEEVESFKGLTYEELLKKMDKHKKDKERVAFFIYGSSTEELK